MRKLALTGSIGMGKSTAARLFAELGVPVWDADAAVHRLYAPDAAGSRAIAEICPDAVGEDGVDRAKLRAAIMADRRLLPRVEAATHPLVTADRERFLAANAGAAVTLCDIPLLFETGAEGGFDTVVVVTAPPEVQRARVLARPRMTAEVFEAILARQTPDAEKRARATHLIDTAEGMEAARVRVAEILAAETAHA